MLPGVNLGANPESSKDREGDRPDRDGCRNAKEQVAVGIIHMVVKNLIPDQQPKDRQRRNEEKGEKSGAERQQKAGKQTESFQRKAQK